MYDFYIKNDLPFLWEDGGNVAFSETPSTEKFEMLEPVNRWGFAIDGYTNDGLPYLQLLTPPLQFFEYVQRDYISVYSWETEQTDFDTNGLAILEPTKCKITEEKQGAYFLELEHPIDGSDKWRFLVENNIVKANGQLFRIKSKTTDTETRTVYAEHITFDLNDYIFVKRRGINIITFADFFQAIIDTFRIKNGDYFATGLEGDLFYDFTCYSSKGNWAKSGNPVPFVVWDEHIGKTLNEVLIRRAERLNLTIKRDNFGLYFEDNVYGSKQDAFSIVYGCNMLKINEDVDLSDFVSYVVGFDNFGQGFYVKTSSPFNFPHHVTKKITFSYPTANFQQLENDVLAYYGAHRPKITYDINFREIKDLQGYEDFTQLMSFNVGDSGKIYSEDLGIETTQEIVKKVYNVLTEETEKIELGIKKSGFLSAPVFSNLITDENALNNIIINTNNKLGNILALEKMTIFELEQYSIEQIERGYV